METQNFKNQIRLNGMKFLAEPIVMTIVNRGQNVTDLLNDNEFLFGKLSPLAMEHVTLTSMLFILKCRSHTLSSNPRNTDFNYLFNSIDCGSIDYYFEGLKLRLLSDFDDSYFFDGGVQIYE